ncbi:S1 family peptidase [Galbibacter mesophilus]|uniref:S1 family peptidase n=1 Tax=Galbibacter mesophilus TaxID=379069 RepID=UPI00191EF295|nr:serine protease [Galbibacter mesophilus]MCM5662662.1 serine protease [Galbibacter mesophilus]
MKMFTYVSALKKHIRATAILATIVVQGQNSEEINEIYVDEEAILQEMIAYGTSLLTEGDILFDTGDAHKQLTENQHKKIKLDLATPHNTALNPKEIYRKTKEASLIIGHAYLCDKENCSETHIAIASGYLIANNGTFVTNFHVLKGFRDQRYFMKALFARTADGKMYQVKEVLSADETNDIAILTLENQTDNFTPLALGAPAIPGATAYVLSNPKQMLYYFTKGMVAQNTQTRTEDNPKNTKYTMCITADYARGSSGGPVVDDFGNLIATVSNTYSIYGDQSMQRNLQMVRKNTVPVIVLKNLIE